MFLFILFFVIFIFILVLDDDDYDEKVEESSLIANKEPAIKIDENVICSTFYINKKSLTLYKVGKVSDTDGDHKYIIYTTNYCVYEEIYNIDWSPIEVVSDPDDEYDCYINKIRNHKGAYKSKYALEGYTRRKVDQLNDEIGIYKHIPIKKTRSHYQAPRKTRKDYKKNYISKRDIAEMLWED